MDSLKQPVDQPSTPDRAVSDKVSPIQKTIMADFPRASLQTLQDAPSLIDAAARLAEVVATNFNALQIWICESASEQMLSHPVALLDQETSELWDTLPDRLLNVTQVAGHCLEQGHTVQQRITDQLLMLATPIYLHKESPGVLAVLSSSESCRTTRTDSCQSLVALLQHLGSLLTLWHAQQRWKHRTTTLAPILAGNLREMAASTSRFQACSLLAARFARWLQASHIAVFSPSRGRGLRMMGCSGVTEVDPAGTISESLQAAATQAMQDGSANLPASSRDQTLTGKMLSQVAVTLRQPFAIAVPLQLPNTPTGIAIITGDQPFEARVTGSDFSDQWMWITDQLAGSLYWHQSPWWRTWQRFRSFVFTHRKLALISLMAIGLMALAPVPYRMNCDCQLVATHKHYIVAPFQGQLASVVVQPGDNVEQGQLLATMDDRELQLELIGKQSEYDREVQNQLAARAAGKLADARIAELEAAKIDQQIKLIRQRLDRQELRSPDAGTLVQGDLRQLEGAPVERGQELFEVASLDPLTVEIELPEYQYRYAAVGQSVAVTVEAFPYDHWDGTVSRVLPETETRQGDNVFIVEVTLNNSQRRLRPGMRGWATIQGDSYPLVWNWLHYPYEKTRNLLQWF